MKYSRRVIATALVAGSLFAGSQAMAADKVLATVNGDKITQSAFDQYVQEHHLQQNAAKLHDKILNELVSRELVLQDAKRQKLEKSKEVQDELKAVKEKILLNAAVQKAVEKNPVTEKEMREEYNKRIAHFSGRQYHARHILVKTKADAESIIAALNKGANFADLAKKRSLDTGSAKNGGELPWFSASDMVPEFSAAVAKLKKGTYTKEPVKTQFGWHVIELQDTRDAKPPKFEEVKPQIEQLLQRQRIGQYLESLRSKAKISVK